MGTREGGVRDEHEASSLPAGCRPGMSAPDLLRSGPAELPPELAADVT
jgi:hypothetical protein